MSRVHTAIVDWDGTAVPSVWPGHAAEFMPGFEEAMWTFHEAGIHLTINSARLSPWDPFTFAKRDPAFIANEIQVVRNMLDEHDLRFIDIWTREGKPGGSVYIDDKAERYTGTPRAWKAMTTKVLVRLGKEEALFPAFK